MNKKEKDLVKSIAKNLSDLGECLSYLDNGQVGYEDECMEETYERLSDDMYSAFKNIRLAIKELLSERGGQ